jgi:hypothetical protein
MRGTRWALGALLLAVAEAGAEPRLVELALREGRLPEPQRVITIRQGDDVTLRWTTDRPVTLHLHGYDLEVRVAPGTPGSMRFAARATGRFPIEIHGPSGAHTVVGYLARAVWYTSVIAIVLGHVLAVYVAHVVALREYRDRRRALLSQLPMLVLMVAYTMVSLWIIAQPIVETR